MASLAIPCRQSDFSPTVMPVVPWRCSQSIWPMPVVPTAFPSTSIAHTTLFGSSPVFVNQASSCAGENGVERGW